MVERIYNRQNYGTGMVQTPSAPIKNDHEASQALSFFSQESWKMAQRSYDLGKEQVLNSIVNDAYALHPENKQKFLQQVQKNFQTAITNLPEPMQRDAFKRMQTLVNGYNDQIDKNIYKKEQIILSNRTKNQYTNSLAGMSASYMAMLDDAVDNSNTSFNKSLSDKEKTNKRKTLEQSFKSNQAIYNMAKKSYEDSVNATDPDGHKILKDTDKLDKVSLLKQKIYDLSWEDLKNFDNTTFKDRNAFMKTFDLDDKEYDQVNSFIDKVTKIWGEERDKREKNAAEYAVARMAQVWDEDAMKKAQKAYPDTFTDDFVNALKKNADFKANTTLMQDDDINFLNQVNSLAGLTNYKFDGTPENERQFYTTATNTLNELNDYRTKYGSSQMNKDTLDEAVSSAMSNSMFSDSVNKNIFDESSAIGKVLRRVKEDFNTSLGRKQTYDTTILPRELRGIEDAKRRIASKGTKMLLAQAQRYNTAEASTPEGLSRIDNDINLLKKDINRQIIAQNLRGYYSPEDLLRMQDSFEKGNKDQYIEINGLVYKFGGFTNNDIILER